MPVADLIAEVLLKQGIAPGNAADLLPGEFLPHTSPVLVLDRIIVATPGFLRARMKLERDSPFILDKLGVPHWCALEFMSQAVAALEGIRARLRGETPPIGYLLGTRCLRSSVEYLPADTPFEVQVQEVLSHPDGFASFDGKLSWDTGVVSCRLSVFKESVETS